MAAAAADTRHSGPSLRAGVSDKTVVIPQSTLFDINTTFTVCYSEGTGSAADGTTADTGWRDSYVRIQITKLATLSSHSVTHRTDGLIARVGNLQLIYGGTLDQAKQVVLVDS